MKLPKPSVTWIAIVLSLGSFASAQRVAEIRTNDTRVQLVAGTTTPRLSILQSQNGIWRNLEPAGLISRVRIGGKDVPVRWKLSVQRSRSDSRQVRFAYESKNPAMRLYWEWRAALADGPIEHSIRIQNLSNREIWIPLQDSLSFGWHVGSAQLQALYVEKGADTPSKIGTHIVTLGDGFRWEGNSSTYAHPVGNQPREIIPFVAVRDAGSGWYAGVEFSGRVRVRLERKSELLSGVVGLNPAPGPFWSKLPPNETFETPTVFLGAFDGDFDDAGNILRKWVREALGNPNTWKDERYPLLVNNSWGSGTDISEDLALRMIRDSAELGLEMFHMDAGWFRGVGDWHPDPKKFPHGLSPIADAAHRSGLKFGLWVDWAQAGLGESPGALNARDPGVHKWLTTDLPPDWIPEPFKGQTIDIGFAPAHSWAQNEVERIVREYKLDMLEHDGYLVAQGCVRKDHAHVPPNPADTSIQKDSGFYFTESSNSTDVSYHAVRAYYSIHSRLRKDHPELLLEVCNDGGRMVDFGSAAHADYFSITDTYDPLSNRRAFYDTSHVLPAAMLESYVEAWPTPRIENFRYMLRSGMMGWTSIMQDTTKWSEAQHADAKKEFELYKLRLRPLIRSADLYHVSGRPDGVHWDGIQYMDASKGSGVLFAFHGSDPLEQKHTFKLRGLDPRRKYRLDFHDSSTQATALGNELMKSGVDVFLPIPNSSELVFIRAE